MSSREVLESKISYLQKRLATVKRYQRFTKRQIEKDEVVRGAVERELYLMAQSAIDLAEALAVFRKFRRPNTMREAFEILAENKVLTKSFAEEFSKIAGFRNALAHGYENISADVIDDVLRQKAADVAKFVRSIQKNLS